MMTIEPPAVPATTNQSLELKILKSMQTTTAQPQESSSTQVTEETKESQEPPMSTLAKKRALRSPSKRKAQ